MRHTFGLFLFASLASAQEYTISTYVGGAVQPTPAAAATSYFIGAPDGVVADRSGNVYFTSTLNSLFKLDTSGNITLVAGGIIENGAFSGDGGPAVGAQFQAGGLEIDSSGNLYLADGNRIRKISSGTIETIAGTGVAGFAGDGGPATSAQLNQASSLFADGSGNLYIADLVNNRIRKISTNGTITTVAGNGSAGFSGDGGPATQASLNQPSSVAVDGAGNMFIADYGNNRVRMVASNGMITTVAGNGIMFPSGGNILTGNLEGDGGPAINAIVNPSYVRLDSAGNLLIVDQFNCRIRKLTPDGIIHTVAGSEFNGFRGDGGPAIRANLSFPVSAAPDSFGNLYIADLENYRIRKVAADGTISTVAGEGIVTYAGDGGPAAQALLGTSFGLALDAAGDVFIADAGNNRIRKVAPNGTITTVAGGNPAVVTSLSAPGGVLVAGDGSLYVADTGNHRVVKISPSGTATTVTGTGASGYNGDGIEATLAELMSPYGLVMDAAGNLYIADYQGQRVRKVGTDGKISTVAGTGAQDFGTDGVPATNSALYSPVGLAIDASGNLYIGEYLVGIREVTTDGTIHSLIGPFTSIDLGDGGPALHANVRFFSGWLALDATGNIYMAEGAAVDPASNRIRKISTDGIINTIAGTGAPNYTGDGGPATEAQIDEPLGITVDAAGNVYFAVQGPNVIRKLTPSATTLAISTPQLLPVALGGQPYSETLVAAGGVPPYTWSVTAGSLPPGLTLSSSGTLSGTPTSSGSFTFTLQTADSATLSASMTFTLTIGTGPPGSLAQIASGDGWDTAITLVNLGATAAPATLNFRADPTGSPLNLPFTFPQSQNNPTMASSITETINPNALLVLDTTGPANQVDIGWSSFDPGGAIGGFAVLTNAPNNWQAAVPLETRNSASCVLAYDNTGSIATGVAIANLSAQGARVKAVIRNEAGKQLAVETIALPPLGHKSFMLNTTYKGTAGKRGTMEFDTPAGGQISVLGLRVNGPRLTTVPVLAEVTSRGGSLAHVTFNGGWQTTLALVNTGAASAEATLHFYDDKGAPLAVPLVNLDSKAVSKAVTVSQQLAPHASVVLATNQQSSPSAVSGSAQLTATGDVSGFAIFRNSSGQEAVAPLETRDANCYVLVFDDTGALETRLALASQSNQQTSLKLTVRDDQGNQIGTGTVSLAPEGHTSFELSSKYATAGKRGTVEIDGPAGVKFSALGIRFTASGHITTIPVLARNGTN